MVSKGQFVGLDWNRIARLHSQVLTSICETHLQHHAVTLMHIKMQPTNLQSEYVKDETTTTTILNIRRKVDSEKNSESQMGFETTTLRDLVGCSNH